MFDDDDDESTLDSSFDSSDSSSSDADERDSDLLNRRHGLYSYERLYQTAMRIKGRAVRRVGELLSDIPREPGKRTDLEPKGGAPLRLTMREQIAQQAGLSPEQAKQAARVAAVPHDEFEKMIEREDPATVTELAERGRRPRGWAASWRSRACRAGDGCRRVAMGEWTFTPDERWTLTAEERRELTREAKKHLARGLKWGDLSGIVMRDGPDPGAVVRTVESIDELTKVWIAEDPPPPGTMLVIIGYYDADEARAIAEPPPPELAPS